MVLLDPTFLEGEMDASKANVSFSQLAAFDGQLRAHLLRLLASGGLSSENVAREHATMQDAIAGDLESSRQVLADDELSFDYVIATTGVDGTDRWATADGSERWEISTPIVTPIKDGDFSSSLVALSSRVEIPELATDRDK